MDKMTDEEKRVRREVGEELLYLIGNKIFEDIEAGGLLANQLWEYIDNHLKCKEVKEQKPRMDIPGGKVVVHLDRGCDVHVIFCADTEEEAIKNMLAGGYVEEEITGIYEADPIGEIPGYFLVNRWRSR